MEPAPGVFLQLAGACSQQLPIESLDITVRDLKQLIATQQGVHTAMLFWKSVIVKVLWEHISLCALYRARKLRSARR